MPAAGSQSAAGEAGLALWFSVKWEQAGFYLPAHLYRELSVPESGDLSPTFPLACMGCRICHGILFWSESDSC